MKRLYYLLISLLALSCNSVTMRETIDKLPFSKVITEVLLDSTGQVTDTLSIASFKYDALDRERLKKKVYFSKNFKVTYVDYYMPDEDLFYQEAYENEEISPSKTYQTIMDSLGVIQRAIQVHFDSEANDTLYMDYHYTYFPSGKVSQLMIISFHEEVGELFHTCKYDQNENPISQTVVSNQDTLSLQTWDYVDTVLLNSRHTSYQFDTTQYLYHYNPQMLLTQEEEFIWKDDSFQKIIDTKHQYDAHGDPTSTVQRNLMTGEVITKKFFIQ